MSSSERSPARVTAPQTGSGASAVGDSATRAVVSGIVLIAVADAAFSVVFYVLGI